MPSPEEAQGRKGVVGVAGTKEGFREEEPRRIWKDEKEFSAGERWSGWRVGMWNGGMRQDNGMLCVFKVL